LKEQDLIFLPPEVLKAGTQVGLVQNRKNAEGKYANFGA
jgi:hypothetical protein